MRVAQERALESIEHRMEVAYVMNDQTEYEALEAYECWHGTMAGIWKADNGGWHKMGWYISFIALFSYWWLSVFSIACFLFQLVMRKWTMSTPNVSFVCTSVG